MQKPKSDFTRNARDNNDNMNNLSKRKIVIYSCLRLCLFYSSTVATISDPTTFYLSLHQRDKYFKHIFFPVHQTSQGQSAYT